MAVDRRLGQHKWTKYLYNPHQAKIRHALMSLIKEQMDISQMVKIHSLFHLNKILNPPSKDLIVPLYQMMMKMMITLKKALTHNMNKKD